MSLRSLLRPAPPFAPPASWGASLPDPPTTLHGSESAVHRLLDDHALVAHAEGRWQWRSRHPGLHLEPEAWLVEIGDRRAQCLCAEQGPVAYPCRHMIAWRLVRDPSWAPPGAAALRGAADRTEVRTARLTPPLSWLRARMATTGLAAPFAAAIVAHPAADGALWRTLAPRPRPAILMALLRHPAAGADPEVAAAVAATFDRFFIRRDSDDPSSLHSESALLEALLDRLPAPQGLALYERWGAASPLSQVLDPTVVLTRLAPRLVAELPRPEIARLLATAPPTLRLALVRAHGTPPRR